MIQGSGYTCLGLYQNLYQARFRAFCSSSIRCCSRLSSANFFACSFLFCVTTSMCRFIWIFSARRWYWQYSYEAMLPRMKKPTAQLADLAALPVARKRIVSSRLYFTYKITWCDTIGRQRTLNHKFQAAQSRARPNSSQESLPCAWRIGDVGKVLLLDHGDCL